MSIYQRNLNLEKKVSYSPNKNSVLPAEKIIAVLSYFTWGTVGIIWVIIGAVTKQNLRPFLKYHLFQSIFLSILFFIVSQLLIVLVNILSIVPIVNILVGAVSYFTGILIVDLPGLHLTIVNLGLYLLAFYLSFGAIKGKYSYIPWVSDIIRHNIGR